MAVFFATSFCHCVLMFSFLATMYFGYYLIQIKIQFIFMFL